MAEGPKRGIGEIPRRSAASSPDGNPDRLPTRPLHPAKRTAPSAVAADDGTSQLLRWGSLITLGGLLAIVLLMVALGGVGTEGAHSNAGWLALVVGAMCLPFGLMLLLLGVAKWLRKRSLSVQHRP